jgi:hypothetical protein
MNLQVENSWRCFGLLAKGCQLQAGQPTIGHTFLHAKIPPLVLEDFLPSGMSVSCPISHLQLFCPSAF